MSIIPIMQNRESTKSLEKNIVLSTNAHLWTSLHRLTEVLCYDTQSFYVISFKTNAKTFKKHCSVKNFENRTGIRINLDPSAFAFHFQ